MATTTKQGEWEQEATSLGELEAAIRITIERAQAGETAAVNESLPLIREAVESLRAGATARAEGR